MAATISWLDASAEEQRKVREIVNLFSQSGTQDEMGGRRIVVALSDALFPGTSVLHSRARYLLFIPWFCQIAARRQYPDRSMDAREREMIDAFLADTTVDDADRLVGLIGRDAGPRVKQLPSTAYWSALEAWGILEWPGRLPTTLERMRRVAGPNPDTADEMTERSTAIWHHGVGQAPTGFPTAELHGGFALTQGEASWLQERWLTTARGSMLAHLATARETLTEGYAWNEDICLAAEPENVELLRQAERFALAINGAQLLYTLEVAKRYHESGFDRVEQTPDNYTGYIDDWRELVASRDSLFSGWDPNTFWNLLAERHTTVDPGAQLFFNTWFEVVRSGDTDIAANEALRASVRNRERRKSQSRLTNTGLLGGWKGGVPSLTTFRWPQVSQMVNDVTEGLTRDARP
jgi:hypothetical protein